MRRHPLYLLFGALVIGGAVYADVRGWTLANSSERRPTAGSPRSVRENPGAYRAVYRSSGRYRVGK